MEEYWDDFYTIILLMVMKGSVEEENGNSESCSREGEDGERMRRIKRSVEVIWYIFKK